jgi:4-hydroxy-tetrahydrodipicolinate synthase
VRELLAGCREGFDVLSGDDATARAAVLAGASGVISVTANVVPRAMATMMSAAARGEVERSQSLDAPMRALHQALFLEANPIPAKWALALMGLTESGIRLPLTELSSVHHAAVRQALESAGALAHRTQELEGA